MKNKQIIISLLLFILTLRVSAQESGRSAITPGNCDSFEIYQNEVVFSCENDVKVLLKLCSESIVKVWFSPDGQFERKNESFAVINENIKDMDKLNVEESASAYELFTDFLRIRINRHPFRLQVFDKYQRLLMGDYQEYGHISQGSHIKAQKVMRNDERFVGLGEKAGPLDKRGHAYKMWNSDKPCYGVNEDPLYKSIPFFMSSMNYGIFFDNTYKTEFDFGKTSDDYYSFESPGGELIYYFIFGNDFKGIIKGYMQLTGRPIMPPQWALGFSQSRGLLTSESLTREIASGYRQRNIPCDIIYQDIGWVEHLQNFEWDANDYENPEKMLIDLAEDGFQVIVSQDPVISQANKVQWSEADSLGYFATDIRTGKTYNMPWPWGGNCGVVDFTNPQVADWWGEYQQKVIDDGVKGFWTDMGEPAWSNEESTDRLFMKHFAGMHEEIHNVYGLTWDKVVTQQFEKRNPNQRVFQMTRAAYAGLQRYTFGWSGDTGNGNDVTQGWRQLSNQIPVSLSAGMGLIPFWSCDISGYCGDIDDYEAFSELFIRWVQFGAFNPLSRIHHEGNNAVEPWLFGDEAEQISREAIELKYQLFPYIYTYAREAYDSGLPLMRAMILEYPDDPQMFDVEEQFMFGSELLVAPVMQKGAKTKRIYLPEGNWIDFNNTKTTYSGSQWIEYPVTLSTIPLFVREGAIIPMMPVMQYIHENENYPVILKVYPYSNGQAASFELYEDDGETNDYKRNIYAKTKFFCKNGDEQIEISISEREEKDYHPGERNTIFEIFLKEKPQRVLINSEKIKRSRVDIDSQEFLYDAESNCWFWDKNSSKLYIKTRDNGDNTDLLIKK